MVTTDRHLYAGFAADLIDTGQSHYRPRGGAAALQTSTETEVLLSGPAGTGKSRACLERVHRLMLDNPGARALLIRRTQVSLTSTGVASYKSQVAHRELAIGEVQWFGGSQQEPPGYKYANGSFVAVGGLQTETAITKIMSAEYDVIFVQEATEVRLADWEQLLTRLRHNRIPNMQLLADANPDRPEHWLKKRCDTGTARMLESRHEDNPTLFDDDGDKTPLGETYVATLDSLTGVRKERLRFGRWVAAEGMIYDEWTADVHHVDRFPIPRHWPRVWGIDFGFSNPLVIQWWAIDDDGAMWLYREIYTTGLLVEDAAKIARRLSTGEPAPRAVVCDHDAEDRATFERHSNLQTTAAYKAVGPGIEAVKTRLRRQGNGRRGLYILRDSVVDRDAVLDDAALPASTVEELSGYVWDRKANAPEGSLSKDTPLKEHDHGCDTMRYVVAWRDGLDNSRGTQYRNRPAKLRRA